MTITTITIKGPQPAKREKVNPVLAVSDGGKLATISSSDLADLGLDIIDVASGDKNHSKLDTGINGHRALAALLPDVCPTAPLASASFRADPVSTDHRAQCARLFRS